MRNRKQLGRELDMNISIIRMEVKLEGEKIGVEGGRE